METAAEPQAQMPARRRSKSRPRSRRMVLRVLPVLLALALGSILGVGFAALIHMPRAEALSDYDLGTITRLFDGDGAVFATYARERRILLGENEIPELLRDAILAAEDPNFFQHGGIDAQGVLRAVVKNLRQGRLAAGGSTLTMQLARKLFLEPGKTWRRKIEEALLTVEIEKRFSKQQIFALYCNLMFLGHGNYGMEAAARSYFGKSVDELSLSEAATLAGILQRPSDYSPYRRPDLVLMRRNYALRRMREEGFITPEQYAAAAATPLEVVPPRVEDELAPYFAEEIRRYLEEHYGTEVLLQQGLQVETTLAPQIQRAAERSLRDGLGALDKRKGWRGPLENLGAGDLESHQLGDWRRLSETAGSWSQGIVLAADAAGARVKIGDHVYELDRKGVEWTGRGRVDRVLRAGDVAWFRFTEPDEETGAVSIALEQEPEIEGAVVVLESATGAVRAMVGGWDFERSKFNRATQAQRQTGSAFKAFVYGAALEMGYTPADTIFDSPVVFPGANNVMNYSPRNFYRSYHGITTLREALEESYNVSAVKLQDLVGVERVIDFARRCGIHSELYPYPSLALGVAELTPLELASAYSSIANNGIHMQPYTIERVTDPSGKVLERAQPRAQKAMEPEIAYILTHMLEGVIDRGTGQRVANLDVALAGKTGTQDLFTDAWFAGFTPRYTILTWVGYDQKRSLGRNMTGAVAALPIWEGVVKAGLEEGWIPKGGEFTPPPGVTMVPVEHSTGLLPGPGATAIVDEAFLAGTEPVLQYDRHWARVLSLPWYQQRPFYIPKDGERMPDDVDDWSLVEQAWQAKAEAAGG